MPENHECPQPCEHLSQQDAQEGIVCIDHPCTCENPAGVETVTTGLPNVQLLACTLCGVLLWDITAHYAHAHPADVEVRSHNA